jgi:hypothetical protein
MPEIPQAIAPTLTPPPEMNPRIAGEPGAAMANAAEQMGSVADYGFHVAQKLQEAQETVDVKMGEVGIDKLEADAHAAMGKATTPEQMQDIQRGFEEKAQEAVNSQKNPKVSRALQFYGAHKSIGIQDLATVRQAKVTTENDLAANEMLGTKYSGDYVLSAAAGGDTTMAENDERILLASSVKHGTMTQEQADAHYDKWLKASKMDTIGALANSPKPADRQAVIAQLKSGNGPLVDGMNLAERNTTLTAAEQKDRELNNLAESQNLNSVLNNMHDAFGKFPYTNNGKGDYEARENAVDDGDFLKSIGAVTPDGKPDRVMGEKLQQEVTRQRAEWEKEAADKDVKAIDKYEPNIAKMTRPQIFQIPDSEIDAHGRSYLLSKWDENYRINRSISLAERQEAKQEQAQKSSDAALNVLADIRSGKIYTPVEIRTMPGLVSRDKTQLIEAATESQKDPTYRAAIGLLSDTFTPPPLPKNASEGQTAIHTQQAARDNEMAVETWAAFRQEANAHPERNKMEVMQEALKPAVQKQIADRVGQMFPVQSSQSWVAQNWNRLMSARPSSGLPAMPKLTIHVRDKASGQTGTIPENEWDATKYEKVP